MPSLKLILNLFLPYFHANSQRSIGGKMSIITFVIPLFLILGVTFTASAETPTCEDENVHSIKRPFYPEKNDSPQFDYHFRWIPAQPGKPTIVVLPGGPGGTSIRREWSPPDGFGVILTDPRGVGCNRAVWNNNNGDLPDDFYTTSNLALDALAAISSVNVTTYLLLGGSYGSMVATVAASLAEQGLAPKPQAVILTGIIGEAFAPGTVFQGFLDVWANIQTTGRVSPEIIKLMNHDAPLGFSSLTWGRTISYLLAMGRSPQFDYLSMLGGILPDATPERREELKNLLNQFIEVKTPVWSTRLYQAIACHEISGSIFSPAMDVDFSYSNGNLNPISHNLCDGITLDHPFQSNSWQTSSPIYYFEGTDDPATPMNQALIHFKGQHSSQRTFVEIPGGGHSVLELGLSDCKKTIYEAIANNGQNLERALGTCALSSKIRRLNKGE
jgi:pimeloyl-ACP methyl ester carboxylesterase